MSATVLTKRSRSTTNSTATDHRLANISFDTWTELTTVLSAAIQNATSLRLLYVLVQADHEKSKHSEKIGKNDKKSKKGKKGKKEKKEKKSKKFTHKSNKNISNKSGKPNQNISKTSATANSHVAFLLTQIALEASVIFLEMTKRATEIDRRVIDAQMMDDVLCLMGTVLGTFIYPVIDPTHVSNAALEAPLAIIETTPTTSMLTTPPTSPSMSMVSPLKPSLQPIETTDLEFIVKKSIACKWLGDLSSRVAELFRLLRSTLLSLSLINDVVVRISTLAMSPIFLSPSAKKLNDSTTLQTSGSTLLQTILSRHSDLREIICEELFTNVNRLPTDSKKSRVYKVENTLDPRWEIIQSNSDISSTSEKRRADNNSNDNSKNNKNNANLMKIMLLRFFQCFPRHSVCKT